VAGSPVTVNSLKTESYIRDLSVTSFTAMKISVFLFKLSVNVMEKIITFLVIFVREKKNHNTQNTLLLAYHTSVSKVDKSQRDRKVHKDSQPGRQTD
jgi:hypothetical protein